MKPKTNLDDSTIRQWLTIRLAAQPNPPMGLLEELRVHNGNAIADVVTVHSFPHCYEIKGDTDKIDRILRQSRFYDLAFKKTTLVTTARHLEYARRLAPQHWGILLGASKDGAVKFNYERRSEISPDFDAVVALLTLWKPELIQLISKLGICVGRPEKLSRKELAEIISANSSQKNFLYQMSLQLAARRS